MEVSVSLLCLFVHKPPYQTVVVHCNPIFRCGSSCMDHHTAFYVRVQLTQARCQLHKSIIFPDGYKHNQVFIAQATLCEQIYRVTQKG